MLSDRFTTAGVGIAYSNELHRYYVNVIYIRQPAEGSTYTPTQPIAPLD
jgi:beta-galactosidase beta subunit